MRCVAWNVLPLLAMGLAVVCGCGPSPNASGQSSGGRSSTTTGQPVNVSATQAGDEAGKNSAESNDNSPADSAAVGDTKLGPSSEDPVPAARATTDVREITFEDLNLQLQPDLRVRPWMLSDKVKALEGQRIRIIGFMLPGADIRGVEEFVLLRNTECKFGPGGKSDHLIMVTLKKGLETEYRTKPVSVEGVLKINLYTGPDGFTWSIYDLVEADKVKTVRR